MKIIIILFVQCFLIHFTTENELKNNCADNFHMKKSVLCITKYTQAYSKKTEQIIHNLTPNYVDKYKISFGSMFQATDYVQLGRQIAASYVPGKIIGSGINKLNKVPQIQKMVSTSYHVFEAVESSYSFVNYITESPFETDAIKKKAKIKYNNMLICNINSYITKNIRTLEPNTLRELKIEIQKLETELGNL